MGNEPVATVLEVVGLAGSLRAGSYNRALLRAATELVPRALQVTIHDLASIRLYNADVEAQAVPARSSTRAGTSRTRRYATTSQRF